MEIVEIAASLFESVLFVAFLTLFLGPRRDGRRVYIGASAAAVLLYLNIQIFDYFGIFNVYTILVDMIITVIYWKLCLKRSLWHFIMGFALYYFGLYFTSYIVVYIASYVELESIGVMLSMNSGYRELYVILIKILLLVYVILILYNRSKFIYYRNKIMFLCYFILLMVVLTLFNNLTGLLFDLYVMEAEKAGKVIGIMMGMLVMFALIVYLSVHAAQKQGKELEVKNLHRLMSVQKDSLERFIRQERELHKLKHELEHKLYSVQYMMEHGKMAEGMEIFKQTIAQLCGTSGNMTVSHNIVDTVIANEEMKYAAAGVTIEKNIQFTDEEMMDLVDLCILLGNLMDNAMEAAAESEGKRVKITVKEEYGCLWIHVANTYSEEYSDVNNFLSQKADKRRHGFGMQSIKETVGKYNGEFYTDVKEDWLYMKIVIYR